MIGQLVLIACGCALLTVGFVLVVVREKLRRSVVRDVTWFREMAIPGIAVKVTELCPPGMMYLIDPARVGIDWSGGQQVLVVHPKDVGKFSTVRNLGDD